MDSGDAPEKLQYTSKEWVGKPWSNDVPPPSIEQRRSGKPGRRWTRVSWLGGRVRVLTCIYCAVPPGGGRREQATGDGQTKMYPKSKIGTNADGRSVPSSWRTPFTCHLSQISQLQLFALKLLVRKLVCVSSNVLSKEKKSTKSKQPPCLSSSAPLSGAG